MENLFLYLHQPPSSFSSSSSISSSSTSSSTHSSLIILAKTALLFFAVSYLRLIIHSTLPLAHCTSLRRAIHSDIPIVHPGRSLGRLPGGTCTLDQVHQVKEYLVVCARLWIFQNALFEHRHLDLMKSINLRPRTLYNRTDLFTMTTWLSSK